MSLFALTVWQPWAWAIVHGFKPYENRLWRPPDVAIGRHLAIHAGKKGDVDGFATCMDLLRWSGCQRLPSRPELVTGAIIGVAKLALVVRASDDPWFFGPWGWRLTEPVPIEPVPCPGFQKLWSVPGRVLDVVRERYRAARAIREQRAPATEVRP